MRGAQMSNPVDPITRSVIQHRLTSIVTEMGEAMLRTSYWKRAGKFTNSPIYNKSSRQKESYSQVIAVACTIRY